MDVPVGFIAKLWSFITFFPFFCLLFALGFLKGILTAPIVVATIVIGNSAVAIGLWPAHLFWTYFCVVKTRRFGWGLKALTLLLLLPLPLLLWPVLAVTFSLLGGFGFGFFAPLIATYEAVGVNHTDKCLHCFVDGCWPTIKGGCTVVRDFTDFCFHSYFSYMDELIEQIPVDEKPINVRLSKLPGCLLVSLLALVVDVPLVTGVAIWKSPYMLFRGWKRLLEDLIGREGPFLETVCVPFAGLAIILWPLAVVGAVAAGFFSSFFLALYSAVVVHQEDSLQMGLAYILAVVSLFDEYTNDLLYLREGSCFPRPRYRVNMGTSNGLEKINSSINGRIERNGEREVSGNNRLVSQRSRTLKSQIQQYAPVQVWEWLFKSCEENGRTLLHEGLIDVKDIEECIVKGNCKKLGIQLPAWSILQCLLTSAKSESSGLVISDGVELTKTNLPRDKVFEWFVGPLLIIKDQIKGLRLNEEEERCLKKLVMRFKNDKLEEWDESGFPSDDTVRRAQLQAIIRRLKGIVSSMSRMPTFFRRFKNLVKVLYVEALKTGILVNPEGGTSKNRHTGRTSLAKGDQRDIEAGETNNGNVA